jgi:hypothetical protein
LDLELFKYLRRCSCAEQQWKQARMDLRPVWALWVCLWWKGILPELIMNSALQSKFHFNRRPGRMVISG